MSNAWIGVGRLAADGVAGVSRMAEQLHAAIGGASRGDRTRARGIAGMVYRSVRGIAGVAGHGVDHALSLLPATVAPTLHDPSLRRMRAALNGLLGDHLERQRNPLALDLQLYAADRARTYTPEALAAAQPAGASRILILIHGLCLGAHSWQRATHDHGLSLARSAGYMPIYVEYNSGRRIGDNARDLSDTLQRLFDAWPVEIERSVVLAHSMGGLVARGALHHARAHGLSWAERLHDVVFLGTPHHGAPLARIAPLVAEALRISRWSAPFSMLADLQSRGIDDLRRARLGHAAVGSTRGPRMRAVAGVMEHAAWLGDGLVSLDSALGRHTDPNRALKFSPADTLIVRDAGHFDLLDDERVADRLRRWLRGHAADAAHAAARSARRRQHRLT